MDRADKYFWVKKAIVIFFFLFFLHIFLSTHQAGMKNVVECYKDFFGYFNAPETNSVRFLTENTIKYDVTFGVILSTVKVG